MNKHLRISLLVLFASFLTAFPIMAQDYQWPLKIAPRLSSQFGDYRIGHWHAGIDITTRGKPGYKVYAVSDGYVFRVKTSYWGYGSALYLKLNDGRYAVYGHLTRFSTRIDDYVFRRQMKSKSYYQDIFFSPGEFPVKKGEYIALSGQSGSGAPHLHLEIRDEHNLPVNPLKGIFYLPDNKPPVLDYLVISRYKNPGLVSYHDYDFLPLSGRAPDYFIADTVAIYDKAVFSLSAYDPNTSFNYGIYGASMILDDTEIFAFKNDRLDYDSGSQINYVRDNGLKRLVESTKGIRIDNDKDVFYRLYILPFDRQQFYDNFSYPAGIISSDSLDNGVHKLVIKLYDVNGNESSVELCLKKATLDKPSIQSMLVMRDSLIIQLSPDNTGQRLQVEARKSGVGSFISVQTAYDTFSRATSIRGIDIRSEYRLRAADDIGEFSPWIAFDPFVDGENAGVFNDYLDITISQDDPMTANEIPLSNFYSLPLPGGYKKVMVPVPVENGFFKVDLEDIPNLQGVYVLNSGGMVYSPDSSIYLDIPGNYLYEKSVVYISNPYREDKGIIFNIYPDNLLFQGNVTIHIDSHNLNLDPGKASVYYYSTIRNKWFYVGKQNQRVIEGETMGGGKFGILDDIRPPSISRLNPRNGGVTSDRTPYLNCRIVDDLSGIKTENQLKMTIDGIWVPAYYDIDSKEFGYQVKNSLKRGTHSLRVEATDNQGNKRSAVSKFTIR